MVDPLPQDPADCVGGDWGANIFWSSLTGRSTTPPGGLRAPAPADRPCSAETGASSEVLAELAENPAPPECPVRPRGGSPPSRCAEAQHHRQPTPRDGGAGRSAPRPYDGIGQGQRGATGHAGASEGGAESRHPGDGLGAVRHPAGIQGSRPGWAGDPRPGCLFLARVSAVRAYRVRQSANPRPVWLPGMRVRDDGGSEGGGDD